MKLLIVEDEPHIGQYLRQGLTKADFAVDLSDGGNEGEQLTLGGDYDLLILDVMLPGRDGQQILRSIRDVGMTVPMLFLTARDTVEDRVCGLEQGADDYLVKPFAFVELLTRMRTLLRRGSWQLQETTLQLAGLELDLLRRRVQRQSKRIDLTAKEFALLELLLRHNGGVLPKSLIASRIQDMNFDSDTNIIEMAARCLHTKVDDDYPQRLVHTARGMDRVLEERDEQASGSARGCPSASA